MNGLKEDLLAFELLLSGDALTLYIDLFPFAK